MKLGTPIIGVVSCALAVACGNDGPGAGQGPDTGTLTLMVVTTGPAPDDDGYSLDVDQAATHPLPVNGSLTLTGLTAGQHRLRFSGWMSHCGPDPIATIVTVTAGAEATTTLTVHCPARLPPGLQYRIWNSWDTTTDGFYLATTPRHLIVTDRSVLPARSPGGTRIAYGNGFGAIHSRFVDGTHDIDLSARMGERGSGPAWSPDGSRIAFARTPDGFGVMDADGGDLQRYWFADYPGFSWSPDGRYLLVRWTGQVHGVLANRLTRLDTYTRDTTNLLVSTNASITGQAWSPDGGSIAYALGASAGDTLASLWRMPTTGGAATLLLHSYMNGRYFTDLSWSPTSQQIAFVLGEAVSDVGDIWLVPSDGIGGSIQVTNTPFTHEGSPFWPR